MNIDEMQAGRELDFEVARKIMGYRICYYGNGCPGTEYYMLVDKYGHSVTDDYGFPAGEWKTEKEAWEDCPHYSTDFAAAMEIPARMRELGKDLDFARELANILTVRGYFKIPGQILWNLFYGLEAAPLIICRAALEEATQ